MPEVICRDCGRLGDEHPNDPAPALCPACYEKRLAQITPKFEVMVESLQSPFLVAAWLEEALHDIGGETREYARLHANALLHALVTGEDYQMPGYR